MQAAEFHVIAKMQSHELELSYQSDIRLIGRRSSRICLDGVKLLLNSTVPVWCALSKEVRFRHMRSGTTAAATPDAKSTPGVFFVLREPACLKEMAKFKFMDTTQPV
jgi:hypothetical protein